jgi:hypothetical protein
MAINEVKSKPRTRHCRYCGKAFIPQHPSYWWCCEEHYLLYQDRERRPGQKPYDAIYKQGFDSGFRAGSVAARRELLAKLRAIVDDESRSSIQVMASLGQMLQTFL